MKRVFFVLLLASCSDSQSGPSGPTPFEPTVGNATGGVEAAQGQAQNVQPTVEEPVSAESLPWPRLQPDDAWRAVLEELQAGAGMPTVPTESGTSEQRQALDRARALTERISLAPADGGLLLKLANTYATNLFPERSLAVLGTRLVQAPDDLLALKLAAAGLAGKSRHTDALALFEHLAQITPQDVGLAGPMYKSYWESGQHAAGRAALEKGLELHPFQPHIKLRLGAVLFEFEEYERALELFEDATASRPNDTEAWFRLASCYSELGREAEALCATAEHDRLIQMEEFGISDQLHVGPRRLELVRALVKSGDLVGARRELDALHADGLPVFGTGNPDEFEELPSAE